MKYFPLFFLVATGLVQADDLQDVKNQIQHNAVMEHARETQRNNVPVYTGDLPISEMTDIGALMELANRAPVQGKNAAMGREIRRQVAVRIKELNGTSQPANTSGDAMNAPIGIQPSVSSLPQRRATVSKTVFTFTDGTTLTPMELNDINIATVSANEKGLDEVTWKGLVRKSQAKAFAAIPETAISGHPVHAKAMAIFKELEKMKSPVLYLTDAQWIVYYQAATSLGLSPQLK